MGECLNLRAELARKKMNARQLAESIGINEKSMRNKINGKNDFTWEEIKHIHSKYFPEVDRDFLFIRYTA